MIVEWVCHHHKADMLIERMPPTDVELPGSGPPQPTLTQPSCSAQCLTEALHKWPYR